ncbi:unnamed protein product, partial [marine sediment metagenome]
WKKLFIAVAVLLVVSLILDGILWNRLNDLTAQLNAIKPGMDSLKVEREQMLSDYASLRDEINLRVGFKQDGPRLIMPDDPEIVAKVQEITEGYSEEELWKDYARLYQWAMKNIKYSLDSPTPILPESVNGTLEWGRDFWRTPAETIEHGTGDCEDISVMLASMLLNYNQRRFPVCSPLTTQGSAPFQHLQPERIIFLLKGLVEPGIFQGDGAQVSNCADKVRLILGELVWLGSVNSHYSYGLPSQRHRDREDRCDSLFPGLVSILDALIRGCV